MNPQSQQTQQIFLQQEYYLPILVESFLTDRKASGLAVRTVEYYQEKLSLFLAHCDGQAITQVTDITADFLRRYLLVLAERHNPGGVHGIYRAIRAFFRWVEFEDIVPDWKNPIRHVKAPKVAIEPIEGVPLDEIGKMVGTCKPGEFTGERDKAILLGLLDTGARATEFLNINLQDMEWSTGGILIRQGKGRKPRMVYAGKKAKRAMRAYLRVRHDTCPALWVTDEGSRLTYDGLRGILTRRAELAGLNETPSPHDFRRAFALAMLRGKADIFALQRLMGHTSLAVLRRYLAQTDDDTQAAHLEASPVDRGL